MSKYNFKSSTFLFFKTAFLLEMAWEINIIFSGVKPSI